MRRLAILGDKMVSGSLDTTLRVWDLGTGLQVDRSFSYFSMYFFFIFSIQIRSLAVDSPVMSLVLASPSLVLYGDKAGKVNFLNLETSVCTRLVPSVKLGMDKYRS